MELAHCGWELAWVPAIGDFLLRVPLDPAAEVHHRQDAHGAEKTKTAKIT